MNKFNVRVYGLYINEFNEVLITDEEIDDFRFTKFPGGGLEHGEGLTDGLKREFVEECKLEIEVIKHFYTTDFFVKSLFSEEQLISIYYLIKPKKEFNLPLTNIPFDFNGQSGNCKQCFRFEKIEDLGETDFTFPVDKHVLQLLKTHHQ
jgi:8-oxo-dGTP diphosphatase